MDGHFRAFSFVDRITRAGAGSLVRGLYNTPPSVDRFPVSLAAEAVGQLAAWAAMAEVGFSHRPLAGIAGQVELLAPLHSGECLQLSAELESVDVDSVVYSGMGQVGDATVLRLTDCVGPMVPLAEYDDPAAVRERFELLCATGVQPGGFAGLPPLVLTEVDREPGRMIQAELTVPEAAAFFADHFPRRAVLPGTILVHTNLELAERMAQSLPSAGTDKAWTPHRISGVKLRAFIPPGAALRLVVRLAEQSAGQLLLDAETQLGRRTVCSAQIAFKRGGRS